MLRLLVLLLLLANAGYFAWTQGWLAPAGLAPAAQSEPQRLEQQVRPDALRVLSAEEMARLDANGARAPECLQAGLFEEREALAVRQAAEALLPDGAWSLEPVTEPGRWLVYMGRFADNEALARKRAELRQIGVSFENLPPGPLEPGLSLGSHATQEEANRQLAQLMQQGVRTARVVQDRTEQSGLRLVLPAVDDAQRARLDDLRAALNGRPLRPCR